MDKQIVLSPYNGTLSNRKKQTIDARNSVDKSKKHYSKCKKPDTKGYVLYNFVFMTFWKRQNRNIN